MGVSRGESIRDSACLVLGMSRCLKIIWILFKKQQSSLDFFLLFLALAHTIPFPAPPPPSPPLLVRIHPSSGLAATCLLPQVEVTPPLPNAQGTFSLRLSELVGFSDPRTDPHGTKEQTEARRRGEMFPRSHSQSVGRNRLSSPSLVPVLHSGHPPARCVSFRGSLGQVWGQTFVLLPVTRETQIMPSNAQNLGFPTCLADTLPPSPLRLEPNLKTGPGRD